MRPVYQPRATNAQLVAMDYRLTPLSRRKRIVYSRLALSFTWNGWLPAADDLIRTIGLAIRNMPVHPT